MLVAAFSEALSGQPWCADLNASDRQPDDVPWFPVNHRLVLQYLDSGAPLAIGPNVIFGNSAAPGAGALERRLMAAGNVSAMFCLSRWYAELIRKTCACRNIAILRFPIPSAWMDIPCDPSKGDGGPVMLFVKGGAREVSVADAIIQRLRPRRVEVLRYGAYRREELIQAAQRCAACFYISREDHYPLAAIEIGLMGCPIISDERACPTVSHGITGIIVPVRERGERDPFMWAEDAPDRLASALAVAESLNRSVVRTATARGHSADVFRAQVRAVIGVFS